MRKGSKEHCAFISLTRGTFSYFILYFPILPIPSANLFPLHL